MGDNQTGQVEESKFALLIRFLEKESKESYKQLLLMVAISSVANGLLLAIINHATHIVSLYEDPTKYFLLYIIALVLFFYSQWYAFDRSVILIEEALYNIRTRLSEKVQKVELAFIEEMGIEQLYSRLTQNDTFITYAIPQLTASIQMAILMVFSSLYLALISPLTFFISAITITFAGIVFNGEFKANRRFLDEAKKRDSIYYRSISDMIYGFKEIKINKRESDDILDSIADISQESREFKIKAGRKEANIWGFGRVVIYALLPILVFIVPNIYEDHVSDIFNITATLLFITGPLTVLVNTLPITGRLSLAIGAIQKLEDEMDAAYTKFSNQPGKNYKNFNKIEMVDVQFSYPGNQSDFSAGPFNQTINRGELLFIIGGNGSGKSTFLKLLTGFYMPAAGNIRVDSQLILLADYSVYRELFSIVFTDFHLFKKLYGIEDLNADKVNFWLEKMQMQHKAQFHEGAFTSTNLSTGQRKRLAFIAAILKEKPILVLDEFAADQDPQFRHYFYETLLPELKSMGKTIIAVTHDDHYFHIADRVLKMDEGRIKMDEERIIVSDGSDAEVPVRKSV